jgi:hypothetical protein
MMPADVDALHELRESLDSTLQLLSVAAEADREALQPAPQETDTFRTIAVAVSSPPEKAVTVRVTEAWRDRYEPAQLADAILSVYRQAEYRPLQDWAENLKRLEGGPAPRPRPTSFTRDSLPDRIEDEFDRQREQGADLSGVAENLQGLAGQVTSALDEFLSDLHRVRAARFRSASSTGVTAEVDAGGRLTGLSLDAAWADRQPSSRISAVVTQSIAEARERARAARPGSPLAGSRLQRIADLVSDPEAFIRAIVPEP